tara:strand:- start:783 stop:1280 length:498 start_codon:yes stop_codon:yes gene_type:complete
MPHPIIKTTAGSWRLVDRDQDEKLPDCDHFDALMKAAREARENAYAPYSKFKVGAAVLMGEKIFAGCNVENASYGGTICAERAAIFAGVAAGHQTIQALALTTGAESGTPIESRSPCGLCRQVISEFAPPSTSILLDGGTSDEEIYLGDIITLGQLLPWKFQFKP